MALPTFNTFSLQDSNFIAERIIFKGYADRAVVRANINRREGIKLLATEFGEKKVTIEGRVIASSASDLQTKLDNLKKALTVEEGALVIESGRTFTATVESIAIPDEHYNQTTAPFEVTFICTNPYAVGDTITQSYPVTSGVFTISGSIFISGTLFGRPSITYTPAGAAAGNTNINSLSYYHGPTGQTVTISGFGSGLGLDYASVVTLDYDTFLGTEATAEIDSSGAFSRWEPGTNSFTVSANGAFPGGTIALSYQPRYL